MYRGDDGGDGGLAPNCRVRKVEVGGDISSESISV